VNGGPLAVGLQLFTLEIQTRNLKRLIKTFLPPVLTRYSTKNNYLAQHGACQIVNIVCRQPVCHYAAPLLGGFKTNVTRRLLLYYDKVDTKLRKLTSRLSAQFPLSVAIETTDAVAVISAGVVYVAVQRKWN